MELGFGEDFFEFLFADAAFLGVRILFGCISHPERVAVSLEMPIFAVR